MTILLVLGVILGYLLIGAAVVAAVEYMSEHTIELESGPIMVGFAVVLWPITAALVTLMLIGCLVSKTVDRFGRKS